MSFLSAATPIPVRSRARRPSPRHLLPDSAAVTAAGRLEVAWPRRRRARRGVRHAAVRLRRGDPAGPLSRARRRFRSRLRLRDEGVPLPCDGPARARGGSPARRVDRRRAGRGAGRRRRTGPDRHPREQQVRRRTRLRRRASVAQGSSSTRSTRSRALTRLVEHGRAGRRPAGPRAGQPRDRGAHARVHRARARRTRSSGSPWPRAPRASGRRPGRVAGVEVVGVHAHIGSQIMRLESFARVAEVLAPLAADRGLAELCVGGGLGVAYLSDESAPTITEWAAAVRAAARRAGLPRRAGRAPSRGASVWRPPPR